LAHGYEKSDSVGDLNGNEKDDFFFTTDVTLSAIEVLTCYGDRWAIEDTFKNAKQSLGAQEPQTDVTFFGRA